MTGKAETTHTTSSLEPKSSGVKPSESSKKTDLIGYIRDTGLKVEKVGMSDENIAELVEKINDIASELPSASDRPGLFILTLPDGGLEVYGVS